MEKAVKQRRYARALFNDCEKELREKLQDGSSFPEIQACWDLLEEQFEALKVAEAEVFELFLEEDVTEAHIVADAASLKAHKKSFFELSRKVQELQLPPSTPSVAETEGGTRRRYKLPPIEFKKFDGSIKDWLPFWSQFGKVHEDEELDPADKFEYLRLATVPNSSARVLVDSYPATAINYEKVISALKARFGRTELQIEVYIRELLKLIVSNAAAKTKANITTLYDELETHLRALDSLGITATKSGAILFPLNRAFQKTS